MGHQRVGCGQPSEHGECNKTMQPWVGQRQGRVMQVGHHRCIRERGSSVWGTDQVMYTNAAGWGQATVLIGPQGFN